MERTRRVDTPVHLPMRGESESAKLISFSNHRLGRYNYLLHLRESHVSSLRFQLHPLNDLESDLPIG